MVRKIENKCFVGVLGGEASLETLSKIWINENNHYYVS